MITSFEFHSTALAMATDWRCPPDSDATGWRIERTVVTARLLRVAAAAFSMSSSARSQAPDLLPAEEHVLDDVEVVAQGQVLVDGLDPEGGRVPRALELDGPALPQDLAAVGLVDARDALDEHRLAGPVVADQGRDLARGHVEGDVGEGLDGPEVLLQPLQLEQRAPGAVPAPGVAGSGTTSVVTGPG